MATTTNYSWTTPDNTAYVKDGASAIRTLGSSVDTTLYTALGGAYPGMRLVKKQTIGSAVSSVNVTGAFSATYENYHIIINGGVASTGGQIGLKLGSTATGYYQSVIIVTYGNVVGNAAVSNGTSWTRIGNASTLSVPIEFDLQNPFTAKYTMLNNKVMNASTNGEFGSGGGFLNDTNSYTDFTITPASGTLTGGTIYVYGYGAS